MSDGNPDVMDTLAGLPDGSAIAELRRQRPDVVRHLQGSDDAIFAPAHHGGFTRPEREAAASRGFIVHEIRNDLAGIPRVVVSSRHHAGK